MRLDAICQFQSGFTVRGKLDPQPEVGQLAMQLRDLREDGSIDLAGCSASIWICKSIVTLCSPATSYSGHAGCRILAMSWMRRWLNPSWPCCR
jgi:hypothetical protein